MSTSKNGRRLWVAVLRNFINSFSARKAEQKGQYIGKDLFGNKFYENPADPSRGKRLSRRSFEPPQENLFDVSNMSAEWDAWLRHRRKDPPSVEELEANMAIAKMKQENARKLSQEKSTENEKHSSMSNFPRYEEYEVNPGKNTTKFDG